jgi:hypothetical protein
MQACAALFATTAPFREKKQVKNREGRAALEGYWVKSGELYPTATRRRIMSRRVWISNGMSKKKALPSSWTRLEKGCPQQIYRFILHNSCRKLHEVHFGTRTGGALNCFHIQYTLYIPFFFKNHFSYKIFEGGVLSKKDANE